LIAVIFITRKSGLNVLHPDFIKQQISIYGVFAPLAYILFYIIATIFFLPGTPITIAGGIVFGILLGAIYTIIGATIGASIAFFFARFLGKSFVDKILEKNFKKLKKYDKKLVKNGFLAVLFFRLIPIFPFNGLNFALGLTKLKFRDYFFGTLIGIIPGSFVLTYFGDSLGSFNIVHILISLSLFILLIFSYKIFKYFLKRKNINKTSR
jgi:uncharacterized membrane protein YdjX (TVP38/TMEM64 family)